MTTYLVHIDDQTLMALQELAVHEGISVEEFIARCLLQPARKTSGIRIQLQSASPTLKHTRAFARVRQEDEM